MHQVQRVEQGGGDGDGAVDAAPSLLEALEGDGAVGEVHAVAGQRQRLADAAAGEVEEVAEGADLARRAVGGLEEGAALVLCQILAVARLVEQLSGHGFALISDHSLGGCNVRRE